MDYIDLRARVLVAIESLPRAEAFSLQHLFSTLTNGNPPELCEEGRLRKPVCFGVCEVVHEMMRCGMLAPAVRHAEKVAPGDVVLQVTPYGRMVLRNDQDAVWDPAGFLDDIRKRVRGLSKLELSYLEESVRAFHLSLYRASLVMLGGASEALMGRAIEATAAKLPDGTKIRTELGKSILLGFRAWRESLRQNKGRLTARPAELLQAVDQVFEPIRLCRNEAAHPKPIETNRLEVQTLLLAFRRYAQSLLALRRHLSKP